MQLLIKNAKLRNQEALVDIAIDGGLIQAVGKDVGQQADRVIDAGGALVTPALIDPHIHLDKVNIFDVVRKNESGTLKEAIEIIWDKKKTYTDEDVLERSSDVVYKALKNGTLFMRTHVDVDTIGGLKPLSGVAKLKEKFKDVMDIQIIAFPQEGIIQDPGCEANLVVVNAKDARDAIRRNPERLYVIRKGKVVAQTKGETELFL